MWRNAEFSVPTTRDPLRGSEPCFSLHFSPNFEGAALYVDPGQPCPRAQSLSFSGRGHGTCAISSGCGLLCAVCAGSPGVDGPPETCGRVCPPRGLIPTCFEARSPRLTPGRSPHWARSASEVGAGLCVWESHAGEPGMEGDLPRQALRAGAPRGTVSLRLCSVASSWDRRL